MFKLKMLFNNEGDFIDTVYPPCDYARGVQLLIKYRKLWGNTHTYELFPVQMPAEDTPIGDAFGG